MTESTLAYLESMAPLKNFWIYKSENVQPGLIHYRTEDGVCWTLWEDDESRFDEALHLLEQAGCPVIEGAEELKKVIEGGPK